MTTIGYKPGVLFIYYRIMPLVPFELRSRLAIWLFLHGTVITRS